MTLQEIYDLVEIDTPADFEYFEQFAELIENENNIEFDLFYMVLSQVSGETISEIIGNYFEELNKGLPDDSNDLVALIDSIQQRLSMLAENLEDADVRRDFATELYKFRCWYQEKDGAVLDGKPCSIMHAVACYRAEKLGQEAHSYEFPGVDNYELDELTLNLGSFSKIDVAATVEDEADDEYDE